MKTPNYSGRAAESSARARANRIHGLRVFVVRHTRTNKPEWACVKVKAGTAMEAARKALRAGFASVMWCSGSEACQPWKFVSDPIGAKRLKTYEAHVYTSRND